MNELSSEDSETLVNILQAASRHPNSRVAKLIRTVEEEASQKNIVLLLMELAEHSEYATDFGISLKYYLNLFEHLGIGRDIVLSEAGLLLLNSSKVYARRVDFVQELVERQILTLSNADREIAENRGEQKAKLIPEKPNRTRKRLVAVEENPYEVELVPKKFRKLSEEKRFAVVRPQDKPKVTRYRMDTEPYIHPVAWMHASIADLENEEEIDSKRNYKLFTYHVEHRYNTLVPDINFRLHFKVKDYIDEEEERLEQECNDSVNADINAWPPLSEEYIQKYLSLENKALALEEETMRPLKHLRINKNLNEGCSNANTEDSGVVEESDASVGNSTVQNLNLSDNPSIVCNEHSVILSESTQSRHNKESMSTESGLGESLENTLNSFNENSSLPSNHSALIESSGNKTNELTNCRESDISVDNNVLEDVQKCNSTENSIFETSKETDATDDSGNDSQQNETGDCSSTPEKSQLISTFSHNECEMANSTSTIEKSDTCGTAMQNNETSKDDQIDLNKIRIHLPHHDDEGIYFSDLDEHEQLMLSPDVVATDVFPCITGKENITIIVDDEIKALLNIPDDEPETFEIVAEHRPATPKISLNILKIHEKFLRRRVLFKLGPEMDLYLQSRSMKRIRGADTGEPRQCRPMQLFPLNNSNQAENEIAPSRNSECDSDLGVYSLSDAEECDDFLGFTEEEQNCNCAHRLSRDSGVSVDVPLTPNTSSIDAIDDEFKNAAKKFIEEQPESQYSVEETNGSKEDPNTITENRSDNSEQDDKIGLVDGEKTCGSEEQPNTITGSVSGEIEQANEIGVDPAAKVVEVTTESGNGKEIENVDESSTKTISKTISPIPMEVESRFSMNMNTEDYSADVESDSIRSKIQKWHEHLQPILAKSRERHHFDVFQIGSEIIDSFEKPDADAASPKCVTFQDVMNNKDESYVSRYFLSSLLLANQNNIKMSVYNKSADAPSAWEDIHFELLSTKRHTVAIEDNIGMVNAQQNLSNSVEKTQNLKSRDNAGTVNSAINRNQAECVALGNNVLNVNLNIVRPLKQIEKLPYASDDYDSGIFSTEDCTS